MAFGQPPPARRQFNGIPPWTGDDRTMSACQAFNDVLVALSCRDTGVTRYQRRLDPARGIRTVACRRDGVGHRREAWAGHPAQMIALRPSADRPGCSTGSVAPGDRHGAQLTAACSALACMGHNYQ